MRLRSFPMLLGALLCGCILTTLDAQAPKLLRDVNQTAPMTSSRPDTARSPSNTGGHDRNEMLVVGKYAWFTANAPKTGIELYRTTGLPRSATLVKDIWPGSGSSAPHDLQAVKVGSRTLVFFRADDGKTGPELWVSDGTAAGTKIVKDIAVGPRGSWPMLGGSFQGKLWFSANDGIGGSEPWVSDGTAAGTKRVKDLRKGSWGSWPRNFTEFQGKLYFQANDGTNGVELWQSDGTAAGTKMFANLRTGVGSSSPSEFTVVGKKLYFVASGNSGGELYATDGTVAGTKIVKDIYPGSSAGVSTRQAWLTPFKGRLLFAALSLSRGRELWVSDGTTAGTILLKDIQTGGMGSSPRYFTELAGRLYFAATDATNGTELWVTDGTSKGTVLAADIRAGSSSSYPSGLIATAKKVLLFKAQASVGKELYKFDPNSKKASLVRDIHKRPGYSSIPSALTPLPNGWSVLSANDGVFGSELWVSDGTKVGTRLLADLSPPSGRSNTGFYDTMEPVFGRLFFQGDDGKTGRELWVSDGTSAGTRMVRDIRTGSDSSVPTEITRLGNQVVFAATGTGTDTEIWISDGTAAGTKMLKDIRKGSAGSYPSLFTRIGNKVWFTAGDGVNGREPWITDGTPAGTRLVANIAYRSLPSHAGFYAGLPDGRAVFVADNFGSGRELWISDGTAAGTKLLRDIRVGSAGSSPHGMTAFAGKVFFVAQEPKNGRELWVTDGTTTGTRLVADIQSGWLGSDPFYLTAFRGKLWFSAFRSGVGREFWSTDGTTAGTKLALDLVPGAGSGGPIYLTAVGSRYLYFASSMSGKGSEPYRTDGTLAGTRMWDLNPGQYGSNPFVAWSGIRMASAAMNGRIYFGAVDANKGREIWYIDNGATAIPIGEASGSSRMRVSDPVLGKQTLLAGTTGVANSLNVLFLGAADRRPRSLGTLVPGSYVYFQLSPFFLVVGSYPGKSWSTSFLMPNNVGLMGLQAVFQAFSLDPRTFPAKTEASNGVHVTMGR